MKAAFAQLNWLWRLVMTGLCFILFGIGGLLLSLAWFNLLLLIQRDKIHRRRIARRSISLSFRFFLWIARNVGALDYRIEGREILAREHSCLVVANHPTLIDYVLLASVLPETDCLVKSALLRNPFVSGVIKAADYLINSQADTLLPDCRQRLAAGDTILIFPEGTRTKPGEPITLQRGAANIAIRCNSDLRVVHIRCSEHLLDKQSRWYNVPPKKPLFVIEIRERISINAFFGPVKDNQPAQDVRRLNRYLLQQLSPDQEQESLSGINNARSLL